MPKAVDQAGTSGKRGGATLLFWIPAAAMAVALFALNLYYGELNQDEGWYLYSGKLVTRGKLPYVDFVSTQGPVMSFAYAAAWPLVERLGLAGGRIFTGFTGLLASFLCAWLASRLAPPSTRRIAAFSAFCLAAVNVYQSYFTTITKTYSVTIFFMMAGFIALTFAWGRRGGPAAFLSAVLFVLSAGTRISAGAVLPVVFLGLLASSLCGDRERSQRSWLWLWFAGGAVAACCVVFLPFVLKAPEAFRFGMFEYHAGRTAGSTRAALAYKAGFISRVVQAYFVAVVLTLVLAIRRLALGRPHAADGYCGTNSPASQRRIVPLLWISAAAMTVIHISAPFPYDDYQAVAYPALACAVGVAVAGFVNETAGRRAAVETGAMTAVFLLCAASAFSSPINQNWFAGRPDRIWRPLREEAPLERLWRAAQDVRERCGDDGLILTEDLYLAVEAGLDVPPGLELGPFSYFPEFSGEKAAKCRVLNREMLLNLLETTRARVAGFSGYGFAMRCPSVQPLTRSEQDELWSVVRRRYVPAARIEDFGQNDTTLEILVLKDWEKPVEKTDK